MSPSTLKNRALAGMGIPEVTDDVHIANGLPAFTIVGLPETEAKEAEDRVHAAIQNAHFGIPAKRITVNLAPADPPKESGRSDLPIAFGILAASNQIQSDQIDRFEFAGKLSLSGELRPIKDALAMVWAMNHSPCGWQGHSSGKCHCTPDAIAQRVEKAYQTQTARQGKSNNQLSAGEIDRYCQPDKTGETLLKTAMSHFQWSTRVCHRVFRIARTITDLAASPEILLQHVTEAVQHRRAVKEY